MTQLASDNFDRGDDSDIGASWDVVTSEGQFIIVSNAAVPLTVSLDCAESYNGVTWPNAQYSEIIFSAISGTGTETGLGAACRCATGAQTYYRGIGNGSNSYIQKKIATVYTNIASVATGWAAADVLRFEANGTTLRILKNTTQILSTTDSSITSGRAGIGHSSTTTTAGIASWSGGDLATGQTVAITQITETDLSQAQGKLKTLATVQSVEADLSQILAKLKTRAVGQLTETDLAQSFSGTVTVAVGQSTESDVVFSATRLKTIDLGQPLETDLAQASDRIKLKSVTSITETDLAHDFLAFKSATLGQTIETDLSQILLVGGALKTVVIGQITEVSLSQPLSSAKASAVTLMTETDLSQAIASGHSPTIGQIEEIDLPQTMISVHMTGIIASAETDLAQVQGFFKVRQISTVTELDVSQIMTVVGGTLGTTVIFYRGAGGAGVTSHKGLSKPTLILSQVSGDQYNIAESHQVSDDSLDENSYLIDGELP